MTSGKNKKSPLWTRCPLSGVDRPFAMAGYHSLCGVRLEKCKYQKIIRTFAYCSHLHVINYMLLLIYKVKQKEMTNMNVMKKAWEIARAAVVRFGGNVKEYFAEALKQAWAEARKPKKVAFDLPAGNKNTRTWVAAITGTHPVYKLSRNFLNEDYLDQYGDKIYVLGNGAYEFNDGRRRNFFIVFNGEYRIVTQNEVLAAVTGVAA